MLSRNTGKTLDMSDTTDEDHAKERCPLVEAHVRGSEHEAVVEMDDGGQPEPTEPRDHHYDNVP